MATDRESADPPRNKVGLNLRFTDVPCAERFDTELRIGTNESLWPGSQDSGSI